MEVSTNILGVKNQVTAQYGDDSLEVQSLGLKRKIGKEKTGEKENTSSGPAE